MKKTLITLLFIISGVTVSSQSLDYNTKKGFVAEGYDVVSYFKNTAIEGTNKFVSTHDSVKYKFSSQENLDTFNANPTKYIPQYGGYCAYAIAVKAKKVSVDPKTFEIRDGKLFLFYNSWGTNTLESWLNESPKDLILTADEKWNTISQKK
ncbi:MAG: hypothetical protein KUG68_00840 [Flavobacteriaceae bacterium]|nr:hypothetical protein [Flavobacteriaceae bacterium]